MKQRMNLPEEVLTMLLSNVPAGSFIPDISRQLTRIIEEEPESSELVRRFRVDRRYGYSLRLEGALDTLRLGGALSTWGQDYRNQVTQALHNAANNYRENFTEEELAYLARVGSKLKHTPSY